MKNIGELGVLQPPIVHKSEDGLRVVMGHRRTLAAVEAKLAEIPVLLADSVEEADRLAQQVSDNDLREGLTDAERGTAFGRMALRGVTPAQIAKRAGAGDAEAVKRALAAKKDPKAAEALNAGYMSEESLAMEELDSGRRSYRTLREDHRKELEHASTCGPVDPRRVHPSAPGQERWGGVGQDPGWCGDVTGTVPCAAPCRAVRLCP